MQNIADRLGITKVSVSKALNRQPGISDDLREKIISTARELGYTKTPGKSEQATYNLAWISPKRYFLEDESFYTTIYYYINRFCMERGFSVSCFVINDHEETAGILPPQLLTDAFDGVFIAGEFNHDYLKGVYGLRCAKIAIDYYLPGDMTDCIVTDNFNAGLEVTNYLIQRGHREIGFVGNLFSTSSICDRYFGYLKALTLSGLPVNPDWHLENNDALTGEYTTDFPLPERLPTAFVCHCDKSAFILMHRLESVGVSVPREVSVISFDNTRLCGILTPKLTSVNIDCKQIAKQSMSQMIFRLENPAAPRRRIYLSGTLVERDSVATIS